MDPVCKSIRVVLLRFGKNLDGEVSIASMMLNDNCEPPQQQSHWSADSDFNIDLRSIVKEIISKNDLRLKAVMEWVNMEHLKQIDNPDKGHDKASMVSERTPTTEMT